MGGKIQQRTTTIQVFENLGSCKYFASCIFPSHVPCGVLYKCNFLTTVAEFKCENKLYFSIGFIANEHCYHKEIINQNPKCGTSSWFQTETQNMTCCWLFQSLRTQLLSKGFRAKLNIKKEFKHVSFHANLMWGQQAQGRCPVLGWHIYAYKTMRLRQDILT